MTFDINKEYQEYYNKYSEFTPVTEEYTATQPLTSTEDDTVAEAKTEETETELGAENAIDTGESYEAPVIKAKQTRRAK